MNYATSNFRHNPIIVGDTCFLKKQVSPNSLIHNGLGSKRLSKSENVIESSGQILTTQNVEYKAANCILLEADFET